jgi:hypothetical protein
MKFLRRKKKIKVLCVIRGPDTLYFTKIPHALLLWGAKSPPVCGINPYFNLGGNIYG